MTMPGAICDRCGGEFWGWSLHYGLTDEGSCPAYGGNLVCLLDGKMDPDGDKTAA